MLEYKEYGKEEEYGNEDEHEEDEKGIQLQLYYLEKYIYD